MALISIENVSKDYKLGKIQIHAIKNISFSVQKGDFLSVVGPSGCGKTTLLNLIGCIDKPTAGKIYFDEEDTADFSDNREADTRLKKMLLLG